MYGPGEGLDRFIDSDDTEALAEFERNRQDPSRMPPAALMRSAAESYGDTASYDSLVAKCYDRLCRENRRVRANRERAGLSTDDLTSDVCGEVVAPAACLFFTGG